MSVGRPFDGPRDTFRIMLQLRRPGSFRFLILQGDGDGGPSPNRGRVLVIAAPSTGGPEP